MDGRVHSEVAHHDANSATPARGVACQLETLQPPAGPPSREESWSSYVRRRALGVRMRLARSLDALVRRVQPSELPVPSTRPRLPSPALEVGDLVRVRSAAYIRSTLDEHGFLHGCGFGRGQYQYCGRELRVVRRVDHFFDEARSRTVKGRNLVLLEGVYCEGSDVPWTRGCQRLCFYFWRTEWLEKIDDGRSSARDL